MPINSNEISNIISGQVGMFSASAQYAQAVSAQYGFQTGGSVGISDPRANQAQGQLQAGNLGAMGARMPGMAMGGLGMMAMMNYAPRIFDPFTMGANMVRRGYQGAGMAGAVGMGGAAIGIGMGIGQVGSFMTGNMVTGAQNRGLLNSQIGGIFPHMNSGGLNMMAGQVESMSRQGMGSIRELASLMQQGAANGSLDTGSLTQFSQSFRKLVTNVREVATVLNSSITEASQAIQTVKAIGVKSGEAKNFLGAARGIGSVTGMNPQQMLGVAQVGSQFGFSAGISRQEGAMGAMVTAGVYGLAQRNENYNVDGGSQSRYTRAATRFLLSRRGRTVLGAMMNDEGEFDSRIATNIARGAYSKKELRGLYNNNINSSRKRRLLSNRGTEIAGQFISQFGPEAIAGSLDSMTRGTDVGMDDPLNTEMLQQSLTGLNRRDINNMKQLAAAAPMLKQKLINEARAGFQEGQNRASATQMMGIAVDRLLKPLREQFRDFGASMTQAAGQAMEEVTGEFVRRPGISAAQGRNFHSQRYYANSMGTNQGQMDFYNRGIGNPDYSMQTGPGRATGLASFANYLPSAFRAGAYPSGTSFGDLPGGGFGYMDPQDAMNVGLVGVASRANVFAQGRNVFGATANMVQGGGNMMNRIAMTGYAGGAANPRYPMMGLTGVNTLRGAARMPGGILKTLGFLGRGGGKLMGAASLPMMALGMYGAMDEAARRAGTRGYGDYAITGNNSRLIHALKETGALSNEMMSYQDITGGRVRPTGYAVSGLRGDAQGGQGYGYQGFLTPEGKEEVEGLYQSAHGGDAEALVEKIAKSGAFGNSSSDVTQKLKDFEGTDFSRKSNLSQFGNMINEGLGKVGGKPLTPQQIAILAMKYSTGTEGAISGGPDFALANLKRVMDGGQAAAGEFAKKAVNYSESYKGKEMGGLMQNYSKVLQADPLAIHAYETARLSGRPTGTASLGLKDAIRAQMGTGADAVTATDALFEQITASVHDKKHPFQTVVADAAGQRGLGLVPGLTAKRAHGVMKNEEALRMGVDTTTQFAIEQGRRLMGHTANASNDITNLQSDFSGSLQTMNQNLSDTMFDRYDKTGNLPGKREVELAMRAYSRGGVAGQSLAQTLGNQALFLGDYDRAKKGGKNTNAKFLTAAARRMGMNLNFTDFKSEDDVRFLTGGKGANRNNLSTKLAATLRELGTGMYQLNNDGASPSAEQADANWVDLVDKLAEGEGRPGDAIKKLSTARPPGSPTSGSASSGGLKTLVGEVDSALNDFKTAVQKATADLGG